MKNEAAFEKQAMAEWVVLWALEKREDALRGNRHGELPVWEQVLNTVIPIAPVQLSQVVADFKAGSRTVAS